MSDNLFKNKYRTSTTRLPQWDYGWNADYFVTICTKDRANYFGTILKTQLTPSPIGELAKKHWNEIPDQFSFIELGNFIVMPNHIHGILHIRKSDEYRRDAINGVSDKKKMYSDAINRISTNDDKKKDKVGGVTGDMNPMLHDNLSRVIRWYKGKTTFKSRKIDPEFSWQSKFYEHIIRDDVSYKNIHNYIKNNPLTWEEDKYYLTN